MHSFFSLDAILAPSQIGPREFTHYQRCSTRERDPRACGSCCRAPSSRRRLPPRPHYYWPGVRGPV